MKAKMDTGNRGRGRNWLARVVRRLRLWMIKLAVNALMPNGVFVGKYDVVKNNFKIEFGQIGDQGELKGFDENYLFD